jgi:hypothetical protein
LYCCEIQLPKNPSVHNDRPHPTEPLAIDFLTRMPRGKSAGEFHGTMTTMGQYMHIPSWVVAGLIQFYLLRRFAWCVSPFCVGRPSSLFAATVQQLFCYRSSADHYAATVQTTFSFHIEGCTGGPLLCVQILPHNPLHSGSKGLGQALPCWI